MTASTSSSCPPKTSTITTSSGLSLSRFKILCTIGLFIICFAIFIVIGVVIGVGLYTRRRKRWQSRDDGEAKHIEASHMTIIIELKCQAPSSLGTSTAATIETPASFGTIHTNACQNLNGASASQNLVKPPCLACGRWTTSNFPPQELGVNRFNYELPGDFDGPSPRISLPGDQGPET